MEATQVYINRWMNKDVAHIEMEILHSRKKRERNSAICRWVELQSIMLSELSQTEKGKYCMWLFRGWLNRLGRILAKTG